MRDIELQLRQAAEEIRRKNHNGWGNACEQAADALANALDDLAAERARADAAVAEAAEAWRQVHLLKAETSGPDGFATWKDAATDERVRRVKAEAEAARLRAELDEIASVLPGVAYMDPPDGGSPSIAEQVRRMRADLDRTAAERDALRAEVELWKERAYQLSHA